MRVIARDCAGLAVTEIARTVCELLDWKRPNGGLKHHEGRQALERLEAEGRLRLPCRAENGRTRVAASGCVVAALGTRASGVRSQRMRTTGVGVGGRRSGEPRVA